MAVVHPDEAMRKVGDELDRRSARSIDEIPLRPDVFRALKDLRSRRADAETRYYVERELRDLRRLGVDEPEATRDASEGAARRADAGDGRVRAQHPRARPPVHRSPAPPELDGLPADFIARHKPDASGAITLTTDAVDARPVLTYAKNDELRRRMLLAAYNVAAPENVAVLDEDPARSRARWPASSAIPNWAAYDMASRMAGDEKTVSAFIDRVVAAARPQGDARARRAGCAEAAGSHPAARCTSGIARTTRNWSASRATTSTRRSCARTSRSTGCSTACSTSPARSSRSPIGRSPTSRCGIRRFASTRCGRQARSLVASIWICIPRRTRRPAAPCRTVRQGAAGSTIPEVVLVASLPGGPAGRSRPDDARRGADALPRVRPRRAPAGRWSSAVVRPEQHRAWSATSPKRRRRCSRNGSGIRQRWPPSPRTTRPASRFRRRSCSRCGGPASSARASRCAADGAGAGLAVVPRPRSEARRQHRVVEGDPRPLPAVSRSWTGRTGRRRSRISARPATRSAYYTYMWSLVIAKDLFSKFDGRNLSAPGMARRYRDAIFAPGSSKPAAALVGDFPRPAVQRDRVGAWLNRETPAVSTN